MDRIQKIITLRVYRTLHSVVVMLVLGTSSVQGSAIKGYEPNSLVFIDRSNPDLDDSLRARLSFKYKFEDPGWLSSRDLSAQFTYNSVFDFFWAGAQTRESGPVVGRVFNPAIHFRKGSERERIDYWEVSFHHRSNGQTTDALEQITPGRYRAQVRFDDKDYEYIDSISRSANYLQLETRLEPATNNKLYLRLRLYDGGQENTVTWRGDPFNAPFEDYDRFEAIYTKTVSSRREFSIKGRIGDGGLPKASLDLSYQHNIGSLPIVVMAHYGTMETLSDHTARVNYVGVGFNLWKIWYTKK